MRVEVDVEGTDGYDRRLNQLAAGLADLRPFWPKIVPLWIGWMAAQFATEGAFGGHPWQPLSPDYYAWKQKHYPGKGLLIREGNLRTAASLPERDMTADSLTLRIVDPKVRFHQEGTGRLPARPLIFDTLPAVAARQVEEAAQDYVNDLIRRVG